MDRAFESAFILQKILVTPFSVQNIVKLDYRIVILRRTCLFGTTPKW